MNPAPADLTAASKFLSWVLRHEPGAVGIQLDDGGWADIGASVPPAFIGFPPAV